VPESLDRNARELFLVIEIEATGRLVVVTLTLTKSNLPKRELEKGQETV
jgi:hypothetical protein